MLFELAMFVFGIFLLVKSSNFVVERSVILAKKIRVPNLIIGLTVIAVGTSLPELVISLFSTFEDAGRIALGNIIGSNIANILLILGISAVISKKIKIKNEIVWKQIPFALLAVFVLFVMATNLFPTSKSSTLGQSEGLVLLSLFAIYIYFIFQLMKKDKKAFRLNEFTRDLSSIESLFDLLLGFLGLFIAGRWIVNSTIAIATKIGINEFLISATVIAVGTSLPELAVSITSILKKNKDLALGNIIGSNILNIFWVLGVTMLIHPIKISQRIGFDLAIVFFVTLTLFVMMFIGKKKTLTLKEGVFFLILYAFYIAYLIWMY